MVHEKHDLSPEVLVFTFMQLSQIIGGSPKPYLPANIIWVKQTINHAPYFVHLTWQIEKIDIVMLDILQFSVFSVALDLLIASR